MAYEVTPEEKEFYRLVREAQVNGASFPTGHPYAGKTSAEVRALILAGTFVSAPEFIPGLDVSKAATPSTAPLPKKKDVVVADKKDDAVS